MGRVKDWLISMEEVAEDALEQELSEEEAIKYMVTNLTKANLPALEGTLRDVFRNVKERQEGPAH
tara:strand:+ start:222 stop:416 length:195 start_codon:yes stop_codon:yes gene_type:complete